MRKSTKLLLALGAAVATPIIINHTISKKAAQRITKRENESIYNWEYGDIRYLTAGEGAPLLLIHGIYPGAGALEFKAVIDKFAQDYKVYALDLLGFGYSDKPNISYSTYLYVRLIKDFIDDIIGAPVTAAASLHSAAALANCAKLNPDDFTKIVLISPTGTTEYVEMATDVEGHAKKLFESPIAGTSFYHALTSKRALENIFEYEGLAATPDAQTLDEFYLSAHAEGVGGKYPIAALIAKFFNTDIKKTLEELAIPYHIITGDEAPCNNNFIHWKGLGEETATSLIEGAQLLPHMDKPEEFYNLVKELLQ
ncbi:MAG: alpha/beta fold hydrolase [Clostridiales bacterium]|jgi:pimeloyl-ACP methyl ester carboxylesterase|nr:alpha/beta fold hydrolase [Clostridiales bacterium]